ncbi:phosphomevalonate kinase [Ruania zhangjianzhongii]|uniref:phosphomevalonate kinase n=1 Tax=Ruania zhangjianzhongii TaxID=2603206 RepID=UPI0011C7D895|nr:phosphomevalonate kinase [Ruania zhangjianzhongii]
MISAQAPGKLFIAGEYAVVEPGQPAVLVAVDRYLTVHLDVGEHAADVGRVHSSAYERGPLVWAREQGTGRIVVEHDPRDYVISALRTVDRLRAERGLAPEYFDVRIVSELEDQAGRKFGLGSSAAVTVALITALDEFYRLGLTRLERFQLALLATIAVSPKASGGDLAAITFGGWISYTSPDRAELLAHLDAHGVTATLTAPGWQLLRVRRLPAPGDLQLLVGWTGTPAATEILVAGVQHTGEPYADFLTSSRACVQDLVTALETDPSSAVDVLRRARRLLHQLERHSGILIETEMLRDLCEIAERHGAAGKPSGAGGGDCGIVLARASASVTGILAEWEARDIRHLGLVVHPAEGGADEC